MKRVNTQICRILGRRHVEGVEVRYGGSPQTAIIPCDTVVFTGHWIPEHELARLGGLTMNAATRGPQVDTALRASAPNQISPGQGKPPLGKFLFQINQFGHGVQAHIYQGERLLASQSFRRLMPNRSLALPSDWLSRINNKGEALRLTLNTY